LMHRGNLTSWTAKTDEAQFEPKPKGLAFARNGNGLMIKCLIRA